MSQKILTPFQIVLQVVKVIKEEGGVGPGRKPFHSSFTENLKLLTPMCTKSTETVNVFLGLSTLHQG